MHQILRKLLPLLVSSSFLLCTEQGRSQVTTVTVGIPEAPTRIDPMIYGQMLENVGDQMIYGGITDMNGVVRQHVIPHLRDLQIPVMRWPGGSIIYEYHWRDGIGPKGGRPVVPNLVWGGVENYQFGTDEFLQWCKEVGTIPYINLNMSLNPDHEGMLGEALDWISYVNGDETTPMGKMRVGNGRREPYGVRFWCIGNENYLKGRFGRVQETDEQYAKRLRIWADTIRHYHPDLKLLGIGHTKKWNETVLNENGRLIDFLTQHYYVNARIKDGEIQNPLNTLFAPAEMEEHLAQLGEQLEEFNEKLGRKDAPIRLSVDEWNNRHSVYGEKGYKLDRQSPRRTFDVAVVGGMLNAFIRQSAHVGMANYIFPVNAHGLIRTVGEDDAYRTAIYHVFKQYREQMIGRKIDTSVHGPSLEIASIKPSISGDTRHDNVFGTLAEKGAIPYVDSAAVLSDDGAIHVSLVNRSPGSTHPVRITVPDGYVPEMIWKLVHQDINATNSAENRKVIEPSVEKVGGDVENLEADVPPCGVFIVRFVKSGS